MHDLRRLRAFHAVAVHGSFSAAGLELGYAQSVVSHHVAALERQLGLTLINRGTRPVSVTDAGARLRHHAEIILGQVTAAEDDLRAIAGLESGTLKVGAFLSVCNTFLPAAVARFERAHPGVELEIEQLEEPAALRKLRSGDLDVAVVWRIPASRASAPRRLRRAPPGRRPVLGRSYRPATDSAAAGRSRWPSWRTSASSRLPRSSTRCPIERCSSSSGRRPASRRASTRSRT